MSLLDVSGCFGQDVLVCLGLDVSDRMSRSVSGRMSRAGRWEWMRCHVTCEKEADTERRHSLFFPGKKEHGDEKKNSEGHSWESVNQVIVIF